MAKILTTFDFPSATNRMLYPTEWFDGKIRKLTDDDFSQTGGSAFDKIPALRQKAYHMGLRCRVQRNDDGSIVFQAFNPKAGPSKTAKKTNKKKSRSK